MRFGHGISHPVYQDTAQEIARDLLAAKVSASLQTDGLELRSTLASLGASDEEDASPLAMSIGQGIYQRLTHGYVPERLSRGPGRVRCRQHPSPLPLRAWPCAPAAAAARRPDHR